MPKKARQSVGRKLKTSKDTSQHPRSQSESSEFIDENQLLDFTGDVGMEEVRNVRVFEQNALVIDYSLTSTSNENAGPSGLNRQHDDTIETSFESRIRL